MRVLHNQSVGDLCKEMRQALFAADYVYHKNKEEFEVRWIKGGMHREGSLHFKGQAIDCSRPSLDVEVVVMDIRDFLGPEYYAVLEKDHIHIEWRKLRKKEDGAWETRNT